MKKLILTACALLLAAGVMAQQAAEAFPSYVQVWGQAEKEITPDEFYLSVTVNEKDSKGKISVDEQQKAMFDALRKLGVDIQKQLRVTDMSSEYYRKGTALAYKSYQLRLEDPAAVADVFDALNRLGISNVSIERVTHSRIDALKGEVRADAARNAKANAAALAEAMGQKVGRCFYIYDSNNDVTPYYGNVFMARGKANAMADESVAAAPAEEGLNFKTIKLKYSIQAKFVLE